jgi:hypothetical protein
MSFPSQYVSTLSAKAATAPRTPTVSIVVIDIGLHLLGFDEAQTQQARHRVGLIADVAWTKLWRQPCATSDMDPQERAHAVGACDLVGDTVDAVRLTHSRF